MAHNETRIADLTGESFGVKPEFEAVGVDRIPEINRTSTPWTFSGICLGTSLSLSLLVYGWLAITFGLGVWSSMASIAAGTLVGIFLIVPLVVIGSKTATNNSTASGAHFGVRGRLVGSIVGLAIMVVYTALGIWSGGELLVSLGARLIGTPQSDAALGVSYAVLALAMGGISIYGYHLLVRVEFLVVALGIVTFVLVAAAFLGRVQWGYGGGNYLLGSFWKTWILSAVALGVSGPMSFITFMGDWSRYISPARHSPKRLAVVGSVSMLFGLMVPSALGIILAVAMKDPLGDFYTQLVAQSPGWTAVAMLPLVVLGTVAFVVTNMYSAGLDLDAIFPRLSRATATLIAVSASTVLVYLGSFVWAAQDSVTAASLLLVAIGAPWAAVTSAGYIRCRGWYKLDDLQVFNRGETGGAYWFWNGLHPVAVVAWAVGMAYGCLAIDAQPLYSGPLDNIAGGVDTSFMGSFLIALTIYVAGEAFAGRSKRTQDRDAVSYEPTRDQSHAP